MTFSINLYSQDIRLGIGKEVAEKSLKSALSKEYQHNVVDNKNLIIKDSLTAINVAEPILFNIYGKEKIEYEKPYEVYMIDNYWVIGGTLPEDAYGGSFLIIIDARNSQVLKITHGN